MHLQSFAWQPCRHDLLATTDARRCLRNERPGPPNQRLDPGRGERVRRGLADAATIGQSAAQVKSRSQTNTARHLKN
jgi:hypothetical protein